MLREETAGELSAANSFRLSAIEAKACPINQIASARFLRSAATVTTISSNRSALFDVFSFFFATARPLHGWLGSKDSNLGPSG